MHLHRIADETIDDERVGVLQRERKFFLGHDEPDLPVRLGDTERNAEEIHDRYVSADGQFAALVALEVDPRRRMVVVGADTACEPPAFDRRRRRGSGCSRQRRGGACEHGE